MARKVEVQGVQGAQSNGGGDGISSVRGLSYMKSRGSKRTAVGDGISMVRVLEKEIRWGLTRTVAGVVFA